jgi:hypothetical protein
VLADIMEASQDIVAATHQSNLLPADPGGQVTAGLCHVAAVTDDEPSATEDFAHLELEAAPVSVPGAGRGMSQVGISAAQAAAALCQSAPLSSKVKSQQGVTGRAAAAPLPTLE